MHLPAFGYRVPHRYGKPFERETKLATLVAHTNDPRPREGLGLDKRTSEVLRKGMALDPGERHGTASELVEDLADPPAAPL